MRAAESPGGAHRAAWWIGGAVLLVLIIGITWIGVREERVPLQSTGTYVYVQAPPANAMAGEPIPVVWEVRAPVGAVATSTTVRWIPLSVDVAAEAPLDSLYSGATTDYQTGTYALPRTFESTVMFQHPAIYSYRVVATIDGQPYWSPEYQILVE